MPPLLELRGITKRFPGVLALNSVDLHVEPAEVLALIGENGAGKSTLMKILGGVHQPNAGEILLDGTPVTITGVASSQALRIGFVHQELNVLDNLDIAGNVFLGREPRNRLGLINKRQTRRDTQPYLDRLGLNVDAGAPMASLSIGQQQLVEIAKALSIDARVIIMDEPTSSLTLAETDRLLEVIAELKTQGIATIYISHRLGEIERCADRLVALRDGENSGGLDRHEINHDAMVALMIGREIESAKQHVCHTREGEPLLRVEGLRTRAYPKQSVSFTIAPGEILGMAGLVGAGRSEVAQALFGADPALGGRVTIDGQPMPLNNVAAAIARGLYLAPEDRKKTGLVLEFPIEQNISLASLAKHATAGLVNRSVERTHAAEQIQALGVKTPSAKQLALNLSGGNQQKVVLGKWMSMNPRVMMFDEPTRGIDVGAKQEIYNLMADLAQRGIAILMISSDMEEVLTVSDRIAVMSHGAITGILPRAEFNEEAVMSLAVALPNETPSPPTPSLEKHT